MKILMIVLILLGIYFIQSTIMYVLITTMQKNNTLVFLANVIYVTGCIDSDYMQIIANAPLPFGGQFNTFYACMQPINRWGFLIKNYRFTHYDQDDEIIQLYKKAINVEIIPEKKELFR